MSNQLREWERENLKERAYQWLLALQNPLTNAGFCIYCGGTYEPEGEPRKVAIIQYNQEETGYELIQPYAFVHEADCLWQEIHDYAGKD